MNLFSPSIWEGVGTPFRAMTDLTVRFACEDQEQRVAATCVATRGNEINDACGVYNFDDVLW